MLFHQFRSFRFQPLFTRFTVFAKHHVEPFGIVNLNLIETRLVDDHVILSLSKRCETFDVTMIPTSVLALKLARLSVAVEPFSLSAFGGNHDRSASDDDAALGKQARPVFVEECQQ